MGSEEDIARSLSTINARIGTPLTQEQERVVQKMLRRQPMLLGPRPTLGQRRLMYAGLAFFILVGILITLSLWGVLPRSLSGVLVGVSLSMFFGARAINRWEERLVRRSILALLAPHRGFVCLRCHYPLTSLPDDGQCPECGTLYTREQTVRAWKDAYKLKDDWTE